MLADILDRIDENDEALVPDDILLKEDGALVAAAKSGSIGAFEVLVKRHQGRILRVAQRVTRNREDAEDVVQQSFQKAFGHLHKFEERSSFSTWLTRIAINEAIMCLRSHRARAARVEALTPRKEVALTTLQIPDPSASPERSYARGETERFLFLAINQLTPGLRTAIQLCDLDEHTVKESAQMMGLSVTAVKSRVSRGRRELRKTLKRFVKPAAFFGSESFDDEATSGPGPSARFVRAMTDGGCDGDDPLGNRPGGFGFPLPHWARKRRRINSSSLNRVCNASRRNPDEREQES